MPMNLSLLLIMRVLGTRLVVQRIATSGLSEMYLLYIQIYHKSRSLVIRGRDRLFKNTKQMLLE